FHLLGLRAALLVTSGQPVAEHAKPAPLGDSALPLLGDVALRQSVSVLDVLWARRVPPLRCAGAALSDDGRYLAARRPRARRSADVVLGDIRLSAAGGTRHYRSAFAHEAEAPIAERLDVTIWRELFALTKPRITLLSVATAVAGFLLSHGH